MVLEKHKEVFRQFMTKPALILSNYLKPNQITYISLFFAIISSILFKFNYLLFGTFFAISCALFDVFDGIIARNQKASSKFGDFLDHTIDRFSDALILIGITFSRYVSLKIGLLAIIGTLLTGYVGTQADAIGLNRIYSGLTSRADIIFLISMGAIINSIFNQKILGIYFLGWIILFIAIFSNITALQRSIKVWKRLS